MIEQPEIRPDPEYDNEIILQSPYYENDTIFLNDSIFLPIEIGGCDGKLGMVLSHEYMHHLLERLIDLDTSFRYDNIMRFKGGHIEAWIDGFPMEFIP